MNYPLIPILGLLLLLPPRLYAAASHVGTNPLDQPQDAPTLVLQADEIIAKAASPGDFLQAAKLLERAVELVPDDADIQLKLGWVYLDKLHDASAAYPHLVIAVKRRPDDVNARKLLALACTETGRTSKAVSEFREAAKLQPGDVWIRANLARALARNGQWHEASKMYDEILKEDPANEEARLGEAELDAWRGRSASPLETLTQITTQDPSNTEAMVLSGDIHRWNWQLTDARLDYQRALDVSPDAYGAQSGMKEAKLMKAPELTFKASEFADDTHFRRYSAGVDARIPINDKVYLTGGADGWRFTNPGIDPENRIDGNVGLDLHWNRLLETEFEGDSYNYLRYHGQKDSFFGGQFNAKLSPWTGGDFYLGGSYNHPFVSSIATVTNALKETSAGAGMDVKLPGPFSVQNSYEWARISDGNHWWEEKPQLSLQLLHRPATYIRAQYDYLAYEQPKTNYWTPGHWHTVAPVFSTSLPLSSFLQFDFDGSAPYVFDTEKFGYQLDGGPTLNFGRHLQIKATGYVSHIPESQVTWSGNGFQAYLRIVF